MLHKCKLSLLRYLLLLYRTHLAFTLQYHKRPQPPVLNSGWKVAQSLEQGQNICVAFCSFFQVKTSVNTTKGKVFRGNRHHLPSTSSHLSRNIVHTLHEQRREYTTRLTTLVLSTIYTVGQLRCVLAQVFFLLCLKRPPCLP